MDSQKQNLMLAYKECTLASKCVARAALLLRWEEFGKGRGNRARQCGLDRWEIISGQSGESYEVTVALVDGLALASCNCAGGRNGFYCHHAASALWAAGGLQWVAFPLAVIEAPVVQIGKRGEGFTAWRKRMIEAGEIETRRTTSGRITEMRCDGWLV